MLKIKHIIGFLSISAMMVNSTFTVDEKTAISEEKKSLMENPWVKKILMGLNFYAILVTIVNILVRLPYIKEQSFISSAAGIRKNDNNIGFALLINNGA